MSYTLKVAGTDRAAKIYRPSIRLGGVAHLGEVGQGGFDLQDDDADVSLPGRKVIEWEDSDAGIVGRGRLAPKDLTRGAWLGGYGRMFKAAVDDPNVELRGIRVHAWVRPSETDVARVHALHAAFLNGSPRATTVLDDTTYVPNTHTVTMPAKQYNSSDPFEVMRECADSAGKEFFVNILYQTFYDLPTSTAYNPEAVGAAGPIIFTDQAFPYGPSLDSLYIPISFVGRAATQDPTELLSGAGLQYDTGRVVTATRPGAVTAYDWWEETIQDDRPVTAAQARTLLDAMLDERAVEEAQYGPFRFKCSAAVAAVLSYGMTAGFQSGAAAVPYTPETRRISSLWWQNPVPGLWVGTAEMAYPLKKRPRMPWHVKPRPAGIGSIFNLAINAIFYSIGNVLNPGNANDADPTSYATLEAGAPGTAWLAIDLGEPLAVAGFELLFNVSPGPTATGTFQLEADNDPGFASPTTVYIDTTVPMVYTVPYQDQIHYFGGTLEYRYWRISAQANAGLDDTLVYEWDLFTSAGLYIVVGHGDPGKLDDVLDYFDTVIPSPGEKAALAGTAGTPSNTNRYVTDEDGRLAIGGNESRAFAFMMGS